MSQTVNESKPGLPDSRYWAHRSLSPGEAPCPVRSEMYGHPVPHFRAWGSYGLCQACEDQYRDWLRRYIDRDRRAKRRRPPLSLIVRYARDRRRWRREIGQA